MTFFSFHTIIYNRGNSRRIFIKNLAFFILFSLFSFLFTACPLFFNDLITENDDSLIITNVEFSEDGKNVKIYLDGTTVPQSRAINHELAKLSHNFFEVVFMYNVNNTDYLVSRASWALHEPAGIRNLYRTDTGIDYSSVSPDPIASRGSSLMFVGTREDRTLLAMGRLTEVDDTEIIFDSNGNIVTSVPITTATRSVTFTITSLESGVNMDPALSSFQTAMKDEDSDPDATPSKLPYTIVSAANTTILSRMMGPQETPYFWLGGEHNGVEYPISAEFTFNLFQAAPTPQNPNPLVINSDDFFDAIRIASPGLTGKRHPRYTLNTGGVFTHPGVLDTTTEIKMINNQTAHDPFENKVEFTFNTTNTADGRVFGFIFEIPVYALTNIIDNGTHPITWNIRPGYGTYMYDIDVGRGDSGGAILMGTSDIINIVNYKIKILHPPFKYKYSINTITCTCAVNACNCYPILSYPYTTPPPACPCYMNLRFDVGGLVVYLLTDDDIEIRELDHSELRYYIGTSEIRIGNFINSSLRGLIPVEVRYSDSSIGDFKEIFYILVGGDATINPEIRYVNNNNDWLNAMGRISTGDLGTGTPPVETRTVVLVLQNSFDVPDVTINGRYTNHTAIIVADRSGIRIGRGSAGDASVNTAWSDTAAFYLGKWPFLSTLGTTGLGFDETFEFTINAGGPFNSTARTTVIPVLPAVPRFMFRENNAGGGVIVRVNGYRHDPPVDYDPATGHIRPESLSDVRVNNVGLLYYHIPLSQIP